MTLKMGNTDLDIPLSGPELRGQHLFLLLLGLEILLGAFLWHPLKNARAENEEKLALALIDMPTIQGNSLLPTVNLVAESPDAKETLTVIVTAYSSTPWETDGDPHITAAGTYVRPGIVANNLLPLGTKIRLPELYGERVFVVEDRMNSKKSGYQIDIWFPSYWEAKSFGAKKTYVEVLEG